jgi:3-oxoacyl-[acyl-carrier-protein] synthase-3
VTAAIQAIEYYLPAGVIDNQQLAAEFPGWSISKIESKTGIRARHIAAEAECSSDLAAEAAKRLFASGACRPEDIDFLLLCTQSPDYFLPTTACILQHRLALPKTAGALDFNLGCSGFIYGLGLAKGLIETGQARRILLITAETYSKFLHAGDRSVRTIFGDGAAATLVAANANGGGIGPLVYGTDGAGAGKLIVPVGGMRHRTAPCGESPVQDASGNLRTSRNLFMDGANIASFTLETVPRCVGELLARSGRHREEIDLFILHQANRYMLEALRRKLQIPPERFFIHLENCGNTVSSTIPIALKEAASAGALRDGQLTMLVGFGVGLSWGAALVRWGMPA